MREIVFDTETTGISPRDGHRIVEIGAMEIVGRVPTGRTFHKYLNPLRDIPAEATRVHGITNDKVKNAPTFAQVAQEFLAFIGDDTLVAHNANFDMTFINAELEANGHPILTNPVVDTLQIAREKFPGAQASLDALCRRFNVDLSGRTFHGALLDAGLLVDVYVELTGGLQPTLEILGDDGQELISHTIRTTTIRSARHFPATAEELARHTAFIEKIKNAVWLK
jgi:DNA polymerase-3 subunit epsilon